MEKLQTFVSRTAIALALFIPAFFMAAPLGYKFGFWELMTSFGMLTKFGPKLLIGTAIIAGLALVLSVILKRKKGMVLALISLVIPVAGLAHAKSLKDSREGIPPIHDISTDMQDPPTFTRAIVDLRGEKSNPLNYQGKTFGKDNKLVADAQAKAYPDVATITTNEAPEAAFDKSIVSAKTLGWKIQSQSKDTGTIEVTDTTFWFGFKDDVVIRIRANEGAGSLIDVRSVSRVGRSDIGANADRIRKFSDSFSK